MADNNDSNVYIPPCGNRACQKKLDRIAEIVTKCKTTHQISGKYIEWFKKHFNDHLFTILHFCPELWRKVRQAEGDFEKCENRLILVNLNWTGKEKEEAASPSRSDESDLESITAFFTEFGSEKFVSSDEGLVDFAQEVKRHVTDRLQEYGEETASQEDEGYPRSEFSAGSRPYSAAEPSSYGIYTEAADFSEDLRDSQSFDYQSSRSASWSLDNGDFSKYPDIFGQTEHQHVFVKVSHILDSHPITSIYSPEKSMKTGDNIVALNKGHPAQKVMSNNKCILLKTLPHIFSKTDLPALASVCRCGHPILQKRALVLLELCVWEGLMADPDMALVYLFNAESVLENVLKELVMRHTNTHEVVHLALLERASNVYLMVLSALVMCCKHSQEMVHKCSSYLDTIRSRAENPQSKSKSKAIECLNKLQRFVTESKSFLKVKGTAVSLTQKVAGEDKGVIAKCAKDLSSLSFITQVVVTFEMLKKVFENEPDVNALSFLHTYLSPQKGMRPFRKPEPESVCIVMAFRALTLFLKYHLVRFAHLDVQKLCQSILDVLHVASRRHLPVEVVRSLHSLLFHPNTVVRRGIFKILDERKHCKYDHIQYLKNEMTAILDPLLILRKSEKNVMPFKGLTWKTLQGTFSGESVVLCFHALSERDHRDDVKAALENHKDPNYNEMYQLIQLQHSNIVQLLAYQRFQVPLFYILEDCSQNLQMTMANYRDSGKFFTHSQLCGFLYDAISGLQFCHNKNRVHRNLTAQCLTYHHDKHVKLSSFGLCVELGQSQRVIDLEIQKNIPFRWSAPESMFKSEYTKPSDIWMVGILIYEVMTHGVLPFSTTKLSDLELGEKMKEKSVRLHSDRCLDDAMSQLISECTNYEPDSRPYVENVKTRIKEIIGESCENPRTIDQFPYPKIANDQRQPSSCFNRGLPFLLRTTTVETAMGEDRQKDPADKFYVSDILMRMKLENGHFVFCEKVVHSMPPAVLSLFHSEDLKAILTQPIKLFQSRESVQYIMTSVPPSSCFLSQIQTGQLSNLRTVLTVIFQVAIKLAKMAALNLVLGDLYPSAVYVDHHNHKQVYLTSLAFVKRPDDPSDVYTAYAEENLPEIPHFMIARAAPELIQQNNFSAKSDVYCFGSFLWESLTAFDISQNSIYVNNVPTPFGDIPDHQIKSAVLKNEWEAHNPCPQCCPEKVYQLMKSCVNSLKAERPTMRHVVIKLKEYYKELFDETLEEFVPDSSPREDPASKNASGSSNSSTTADSLSECNPSSVGTQSEGASLVGPYSDWGSMFSSVVSLEEINPTIASCSTLDDSSRYEDDEEVYGFGLSNKYVDVDYSGYLQAISPATTGTNTTTTIATTTRATGAATTRKDVPDLPSRTVSKREQESGGDGEAEGAVIAYADDDESYEVYLCSDDFMNTEDELYTSISDLDELSQGQSGSATAAPLALPEVPQSTAPVNKPSVPTKPSVLKKPRFPPFRKPKPPPKPK